VRRITGGLFLVTLATLLLEVLLTRVFDVILAPNLGYLVIASAMFALGVGGIYEVLRPGRGGLAAPLLAFGAMTCVLPWALNTIRFDFGAIAWQPIKQLLAFGLLYAVLVLPFFSAGLFLARLFGRYPERIGLLYAWDLAGAALGCALVVPLLPRLGPVALMIGCGGLGFLGSAAFLSGPRRWLAGALAVAALVSAGVAGPHLDLRYHVNRRGVRSAIEGGRREFARWDPTSKIDVLDEPKRRRKHVAYDGGGQSSHIYPFDGDLPSLRARLFSELRGHFWQRGVLASHWLKRDSGHVALVIGAAGGQEVKAALLMRASQVDAVEMVPTVVELAKGKYAGYNGGIFRRPEVNLVAGEGRAFLRRSGRTYDVIQIFSNHTSSSLASGSGAISSVYLQTVEAYREYFQHLSPGGMLQVNHHIYPRMVVTAARAWRDLGRTDFRRHVVVVERALAEDNLPTLLVKNEPWSARELADLEVFFSIPSDEEGSYAFVEHPLDPARQYLPAAFFEGELPHSLASALPYRCDAPTDDRPFFNFLRKHWGRIQPDPARWFPAPVASFLNDQVRNGVPLDVAHLLLLGIISIGYAILFTIVPLTLSRAGRAPWPGKGPTLLYFACLGAAFIAVELVLIQMLSKLIGYPLYAVTLVLIVVLGGAGLGARSASGPGTRPSWTPFAGIAASAGLFLLLAWLAFPRLLASPAPIRAAAAALSILPLAFFMGMPFPAGVMRLGGAPPGAIAWAWGVNGLTTVMGGLASIVSSLFWGFRATLLLAILVYAVAAMAIRFLPTPPPVEVPVTAEREKREFASVP
jgi:hypothetical protein